MLQRLAAIPRTTAVVLLAAAMLALWGLASQRLPGADRQRPVQAAAARSTDHQIAFWSSRAERDELDYLSRTYLGAAHVATGRRTGDFDAYDRAEAPLREALDLNPRYGPALSTLAAVHLARHEFPAALAAASQAREHDPTSVEALAALGDAHLELGDYDLATDAYELLFQRQPGAAAEARLARLAFLRGRPIVAIEQAQRALELAGSNPDPSFGAALATYALDAGDVELAARTAETGFTAEPDSPAAIETLAQVRAVQGRLPEAAVLYERLLALGPDPGAHSALAGIYVELGRHDDAGRHRQLVEPAAQSVTESQVVFDREIAVHLADNGLDVERAVAIAERDLQNRQDIYAYDTLAWARHSAGDFSGAREAMDQALALGTRDPHLLYHAGIIAASSGDDEQAARFLTDALSINPHFDVGYAPHAARTLEVLGS